MSQKGFSNILVSIVVGLLLLGGGFYFLSNRNFEISISGPGDTHTYTSTTSITTTTTTQTETVRPDTTELLTQSTPTKTTAPARSIPFDWITYTSSLYEYEFSIPGTYAFNGLSAIWATEAIRNYSPFLPEYTDLLDGIGPKSLVEKGSYGMYFFVNPAFSSLDEFIAHLDGEIKQKGSSAGLQDLKREKVVINQREFIKETYLRDSGGVKVTYLAHYVYDRGFIYGFLLVPQTGDESTYEAILKTFHFVYNPVTAATPWKIYKNKKYGFEIQYPPRFIVLDGGSGDMGGGETTSIRFHRGYTDFLTFEILKEGPDSKFYPISDEFHVRVTSREDTQVDGLPAKRIEAEQYKVWNKSQTDPHYVPLEPACPIVQAYWEKNSLWYSLYGSCGRGDNGKFTGAGKPMYLREEFDKMISSFQFTK